MAMTATQTPNHRRQTSLRGSSGRWRRTLSGLAAALIAGAAFVGVAVLLIIMAYIVVNGLPALNLAFFMERPLPFGEAGGGVAPAIVGTLYMLAVASLLGVPIGIGTAIYLSEFGRGRFADVVRFVIDVIAGVPSIVIGVFVWAFLVRHVVGGYSGLAGAVALSIIMVPVVTRTVEEILRLVPDALREAALALGVPQWKTILRVVLPTARAGVVTGVVLAAARAAGETAPLLLTALGNMFFNYNLLTPMASLPVQIYTYAMSPYADWHTKAWGSSLILVVIIGLLSLATRWVTRGQRLG